MLQKLLQGVSTIEIVGELYVIVGQICLDSRKATLDGLFVAIVGNQTDGHQYIEDAIRSGNKVIVCEKLPAVRQTQVTYVQVPDTTEALGIIANNFYQQPSKQLKLVAVTGTSGKTSTVHLAYHLFRGLGYSVGMLSTIHNQVNDELIPSTHTTPHAIEINQLLRKMVDAGCQYCFMEASSHAIVQKRLAGLQLAGAVFLNISHDHLDYHVTFDEYIKAKKMLFDALPAQAFALYNLDDKRGRVMTQNTRAKTFSMALQHPANFSAKILANSWEGLELRIDEHVAWFQLLGIFNAANLLAAYAMARLLDQPSQDILVALSAIRPISGRFQHIRTPKKVDVIIDYAHKPEALEKILLSIHQIRTDTNQPGRMITLIGCGGNRDTAKRPLMAKIAYQLSDLVILTADNPRYEDPKAIVEEMKEGLTSTERLKAMTILDREEAIRVAYQMAQPADILLIAGKGHEDYQEIAGVKYPLSDMAIIHRLIIN